MIRGRLDRTGLRGEGKRCRWLEKPFMKVDDKQFVLTVKDISEGLEIYFEHFGIIKTGFLIGYYHVNILVSFIYPNSLSM